jgi:hypothetical protein
MPRFGLALFRGFSQVMLAFSIRLATSQRAAIADTPRSVRKGSS